MSGLYSPILRSGLPVVTDKLALIELEVQSLATLCVQMAEGGA